MSAVVHLALDANALLLRVERPGHADAVHKLPLGTAALVARFFKHLQPSAYALEEAIALVEDVVMPLAAQLPPDALWFSDSPAVRALNLGAQAAELDIDTVEHQFNALADWVQGRPATLAGIPQDAHWCATLLVLRECMHHWRCPVLVLRASRTY
jgi:hypothetical protein